MYQNSFPKYFISVLTVFFLFSFFVPDSFPQSKKVKKKENDANGNFADGNFDVALNQFLKIFQKDKLNVDYNYKIGICYLYTNIDKTLALPYLEFAAKQSNATNETFFYLGKAYYYSHQFDKAKDMFEKYHTLDKNTIAADEELRERYDKALKYLDNARDFTKRPLNVTFSNLGKVINSNRADYNPFITDEEKTLFFTSNRKYISEYQEYTNDIYMTNITFWGRWGTAKSIGSKINTSDEQEIMAGMSHDGEWVFIEPDNYIATYDILLSKNVKGKYGEPENPGPVINSKERESGATVTISKDTLYFSSKREGGLGGFDLWMSIKLPDGTWGPPQNLGENINTPDDENMPVLSKDGNTLYFCSDGHNSMGGFDIFYSKRNNVEEKWPKPKNMGYPVNDTYDNMMVSLSEKGKYGYIAAIRKEGYGDYDVYKVVFKGEESKPIVFKGKIAVGDSLRNKSPKEFSTEISIVVKEKLATDIFGKYAYNKKNDSFVISLPPGIYDLEVESPGYKPYKKTIEVVEEMANEGVLNYNIFLKPK